MSTSEYFNNFNNVNEQNLIDELVEESIKIYGIDCYYLPKNIIHRDEIFRDTDVVSYNSAYTCEMYVKDVQGFTGDGKFLSKFGLEVRDEMTFTISMRAFENNVGRFANIVRPNEGDLIFFPLNKKAFSIKFVDHEAVFYQMGSLQMWDVVCEVFEWSDEKFKTGITEIDSIYNKIEFDASEYAILDENGSSLITEHGEIIIDESYDIEKIVINAQNDEFETDADKILDFTEFDPFSESLSGR